MGCCGFLQKWTTLLLYLTGLALSSYAYYVEMMKEADENYIALCDIDENMSCSKVFNSKFGKGFGLVSRFTGDEKHPLNQPNALYGIFFYSILGLLFICGSNSRFLASLQFYSFVLANCMSVYFGYILYFVLEDLCVVCIATYAVNFLLLLLNLCKKKSLSRKVTAPIMQSNYGRYEPTLPSFRSQDSFKKNI